jgi:hypothetical protein
LQPRRREPERISLGGADEFFRAHLKKRLFGKS